ncbi:MAG: hypothetical protein JNL96_08125 [Planctomycetaceae bacterium]|nr:hypothetical protein [Planctomycetaceae bacterium]
MSEDEFELYLRLLGKFLRLKPGQRAEISDELRDHLESRLDELTQSGLDRTAAIERALDEFGDAASLADHFSKLVYERKRRLVMRCTLGTVAAAAAALMVGSMFWPQGPGAGGPAPQMAQAEVKESAPPPANAAAREAEQDRMVREKLEAAKVDCDFDQVPLSDVLTVVSDRIAVDVYVPKQEFEAELAAPITLQIRHTQLSGRAVLDLALRQAQLAYTVRDGLIMVCRPDTLTEVRVYNVSHLNLPELQLPDEPGGFGGVPAEPRPNGEPKMKHLTGVECLVEFLPQIVTPDAWSVNGGAMGDAAAWGTLLLVRATPEMHREIEALLRQLAAPQTVSN